MYAPSELARFALSEFERGLENLTDVEARQRLTKADGTEMNAISWIVGHIGAHWIQAARVPTGQELPKDWQAFASATADPTPPSLDKALEVLHAAQASISWIEVADDELMLKDHGKPAGETSTRDRPETVGTRLIRAVLHTWFHIGEINAIRQMQGYPEIRYVGSLNDYLEWRPWALVSGRKA
jgi:hypothetical protein